MPLDRFVGTEMDAGYDPVTNTWEVIVKYNGDIFKIKRELGAEVEILHELYAIITLSADKVPLLYNFSEIEYIEKPRTLTPALRFSAQNACVRSVQSPAEYNLTGKGVIVAIIDSGIDYTHPDFRNLDGTTRILYIWDQTVSGTPPLGLAAGAEYTEYDINNALENSQPFSVIPQVDILGHGTAVSGIASGNGRASQGTNMGVAPESGIIAVKLGRRGIESFARTTELMRAIKYVIDKALILRMPISINISYGMNDGAHDGNSLFETYIDDMANRWKTVITVASGNEGAAGHHHAGQLGTNEMVDVEIFIPSGISSFFISMWKNFVDTFSVELILPNGRTTGIVNYFDRIRRLRSDDTDIIIRYGQPNQYSADQEIYFQATAPTGTLLQGVWRVRIRSGNIVEGMYHMWLPSLGSVGSDTFFARPSTDITLTLPSTAKSVITVGGYDYRLNIMANFSGQGYTRNFVYTKPDLVAPAVGILTTAAGGGYDSFTGTSFAAPFVAGSAALMMEWGIVNGNDRFLYGQKVKAFLRIGTQKPERTSYPNNRWGYGTLCLKNSMDYLVRYR